jgi:mRNA-degrading endonuclease YafQ of YafQ-DinJ toxin-antitoxin module
MGERIGDDQFKKIYRPWIRRHPELKAPSAKKTPFFPGDPVHPLLKPHTLGGVLPGLWSCRITDACRLVFDVVDEKRTQVLLIDRGSHEEVS